MEQNKIHNAYGTGALAPAVSRCPSPGLNSAASIAAELWAGQTRPIKLCASPAKVSDDPEKGNRNRGAYIIRDTAYGGVEVAVKFYKVEIAGSAPSDWLKAAATIAEARDGAKSCQDFAWSLSRGLYNPCD